MTKTTRRGFLGALFCAAAWKPRKPSLGYKLHEITCESAAHPLGQHMAVYRHAYRPVEYQGEWRWLVFHERKLEGPKP